MIDKKEAIEQAKYFALLNKFPWFDNSEHVYTKVIKGDPCWCVQMLEQEDEQGVMYGSRQPMDIYYISMVTGYWIGIGIGIGFGFGFGFGRQITAPNSTMTHLSIWKILMAKMLSGWKRLQMSNTSNRVTKTLGLDPVNTSVSFR